MKAMKFDGSGKTRTNQTKKQCKVGQQNTCAVVGCGCLLNLQHANGTGPLKDTKLRCTTSPPVTTCNVCAKSPAQGLCVLLKRTPQKENCEKEKYFDDTLKYYFSARITLSSTTFDFVGGHTSCSFNELDEGGSFHKSQVVDLYRGVRCGILQESKYCSWDSDWLPFGCFIRATRTIEF